MILFLRSIGRPNLWQKSWNVELEIGRKLLNTPTGDKPRKSHGVSFIVGGGHRGGGTNQTVLVSALVAIGFTVDSKLRRAGGVRLAAAYCLDLRIGTSVSAVLT